jgi:short-subunit dehydrogenase
LFFLINVFCLCLGRIITISSHCALETLPGLAVYGATKTALRAWSDGLRVELAKFKMHVVTLIPGKHQNIKKKIPINIPLY